MSDKVPDAKTRLNMLLKYGKLKRELEDLRKELSSSFPDDNLDILDHEEKQKEEKSDIEQIINKDVKIEENINPILNIDIKDLKIGNNDFMDSIKKHMDKIAELSKPIPKAQEKPVIDPNNKLMCQQCGIVEKDITSLQDHIMIYHEEAFGVVYPYSCLYCNLGYRYPDEIAAHENLCRRNPKNAAKYNNSVPSNPIEPPIPPPKPIKEFRHKYEENEEDDGEDGEDEELGANGVDNIPVVPNGKHQCPVCKNKYATQYYLGEHFIISHNNYETQLILDKKKQPGGFPGFNVLRYIKMIGNTNLDAEYIKKESCILCCNPYFDKIAYLKSIRNKVKLYNASRNLPLEPLNIDISKFAEEDVEEEEDDDDNDDNDDDNEDNEEEEDEEDNGCDCEDCNELKKQSPKENKPESTESVLIDECTYDSDTELYMKNKPNKNKRTKCDIDIYYKNDINITIPELYDCIVKNSPFKRKSVELLCCNTIVCEECLENNIKSKNDIICPFCRRDHNQRDQDYIVYYNISKFNKSAWEKWWENHQYEIFFR